MFVTNANLARKFLHEVVSHESMMRRIAMTTAMGVVDKPVYFLGYCGQIVLVNVLSDADLM